MSANTAPPPRLSSPRAGVAMAVVSMLCVQVGLAEALTLVDDLGAAGTT